MLDPVIIILPETETKQDVDLVMQHMFELRGRYANEKYDKPNYLLMHPRKWDGFERVSLMDLFSRGGPIKRDPDGKCSFYGIPVIRSYDVEVNQIIFV